MPCGTNIPAYMEQIRLGNFAALAQILMDVNPYADGLPAACAHISARANAIRTARETAFPSET